MSKTDIIIIGSSTMDMTAKSKSLPLPGQTVLGEMFVMGPGGKGANQAVASRRLGADVRFITKLGHDTNGEMVRKKYELEGIVTEDILYSDTHTGVALIMVDDNGENSIIMTPGANRDITVEDIEALTPVIESARFLILQLEIPVNAVMKAAEIAHKAGVYVILNPAPACEIPDEIYNNISLITPNETEAAFITGNPVTSDPNQLEAALNFFHSKGVKNIIITLGSHGSLISEAGRKPVLIPAIKVNAIDTTGAGDTYTGALCVALSEGKSLVDAAQFATKACALSVQRMGAMTGIPHRDELESWNS